MMSTEEYEKALMMEAHKKKYSAFTLTRIDRIWWRKIKSNAALQGLTVNDYILEVLKREAS